MTDFLQHIRTHFNVIHKDDYLSLTLIKYIYTYTSSNISAQIMNEIKQKFKLMSHIRKQQIIIIQTPNFDDELLSILAQSLPTSLSQLTLDFTGCESLKGSGFLDLFEKISTYENLNKLHLDFSQIYDINDFVIEGLTMLLETLNGLTQFYLDLYEVDQISEDGYLLLAQSISHLQNLKKIHIDVSANPHLTQDSLQLMFSSLPKTLTSLGFRILDIQHIGGGSFFKLSEMLNQMKNLSQLNLTISTFLNIDHKGTYSIIKSISQLKQIKKLALNLSNINLPEKTLSLFKFAETINQLSLDVSCNINLTDRDIVSFCQKIPVKNVLKFVSFNFDFCKKISDQAIQTLIERVCQNKSLMRLTLPDRKYNSTFINSCIKNFQQSNAHNSLIMFNCNAVQQMNKNYNFKQLQTFKDKQKLKRNILFASHLIKKNNTLSIYQKDILRLFIS